MTSGILQELNRKCPGPVASQHTETLTCTWLGDRSATCSISSMTHFGFVCWETSWLSWFTCVITAGGAPVGCKLRGASHTGEIQRAVTLHWCWVLCCLKNWGIPSQPQAYLNLLCCLNFPLLKNSCKASPHLIFLSVLLLFWLDLNAMTLNSVNSIIRERNTLDNIYAIQSQRLSILLWTLKNSDFLLQNWVCNWQFYWAQSLQNAVVLFMTIRKQESNVLW